MRILLLAGGGGTRLWPLSTEQRPKQFLPLLSDRSLLAETYARLRPLTTDVFVATLARLAPLVAKELPELSAGRILTEPVRRNSGPALLAAAVRFAADGDPITAAIPSDQTVRDAETFRGAIAAAAGLADSSSVVLLAVPPTRPETDFGYLEVRNGEVIRFIEKPSAEKAVEYAASGLHFWNAGMFVFRPSRFLGEARRVAGELLSEVERSIHEDGGSAYESLPNVSIDVAVMEKASGVRAVPLSAGWSDVGTWRSVRELRGASDESGNLVLSPMPVLAPGVRNTAIVVGAEGALVLPFDREGELRAAVEDCKRREEDAGRKG
ncbi:MAG TPA: sugar phosphate nucleotidyltransferase [Thermoanaerobaculia bacterium]|jgi:mannose-1-phosphate guanylyltransferase